jgi:hypothetical protein
VSHGQGGQKEEGIL